MGTSGSNGPVGAEARGGLRSRLGGWIRRSSKLHAVVIVVLGIGSFGLAAAGRIEVSRAEQRAAEQQAALVKTTNEALTAQESALLRLSALPLGWAIRSALLKDDLTSIQTYVQRLVQEQHVTSVVLVGPDGNIRVASNEKLTGLRASAAFPEVALDKQSPVVTATDKDVRVVVPVMGYDRRLGTLILSYARPPAMAR